jgi:hypothetical protein
MQGEVPDALGDSERNVARVADREDHVPWRVPNR